MAAKGTLVIRFIGDIKDFERDLRRVEGATQSRMKAVGKWAARGAAVGGAALIGMGATAARLEADFSKTMNKVQAATNTPARGMKALQDLAIKMGQDTVFSAADASEAMLELAKGGMKAATIRGGALEGTLQLAAAGELAMGDAANVAVKAMGAFGLQGKDVAQVADALSGAANASSSDVSDLSVALSQGGLAAHAAGLGIDETTAALAAFANAGLVGSDAGTSLKTFLMRLVPQTSKASEAFRELGLRTKDGSNAFVKANGDFKSAAEIAGILHKATKDLTQEEKTLYLTRAFGTDAFRAANVLANEGEKGLRKYLKATRDTQAAERMAEAGMKGTAGAVEQLKGSLETLTLQFGIFIRPAVVKGLGLITEGVNQVWPTIEKVVEKLSGGSGGGLSGVLTAIGDAAREYLVPAFEGLAGAAKTVMPYVESLIGALRDNFLPALEGIIPIVAPVAAFIIKIIGGALIGALKGALQFLRGVVDIVAGVFKLVKALVTGDWSAAWQAVKDIVGGVIDAVVGALKVWFNLGILAIFKQGLKLLLKGWRSAWEWVKSIGSKAFRAVEKVIGSVWRAIGRVFKWAWDKAVRPVFDAIVKFIRGPISSVFNFYRGLVSKVWGFVRTAFSAAWRKILPILTKLKDWVGSTLGKAFEGFKKVAETVWFNVRTALWLGWTKIKSVFEKLKGWVGRDGVLATAFRAAVSGISSIWAGLQRAAAVPVNFLINTVYNNGLRKMLNLIPGVSLAKASPVSWGNDSGGARTQHGRGSSSGGTTALAGGGWVYGPGTETSDSIPALLSRNEFVVQARYAKRMRPLLEAINRGELPGFAKGGPVWPTTFRSLSNSYAGHTGVDISIPGSGDYGLPVFAAHAGRAVSSYASGSYGNYVRVYGSGYSTIYAHLAEPGFTGPVQAGQQIGRIGSTGNSTGPHLHFEIRPGGTYGSALAYLTGASMPSGGSSKQSGLLAAVGRIKDIVGKVRGWLGELGNMGGFGGLMRDAAKSVAGKAVDWVNGKIPGPGPIPNVFDRGGIWRGGLAANLSGQPERVLDPRTTRSFEQLVAILNDQAVRGALTSLSSFGAYGPNGMPRRHATYAGSADHDVDEAGSSTRPIQVTQNFPTSADPRAAANAAAERLVAKLGG